MYRCIRWSAAVFLGLASLGAVLSSSATAACLQPLGDVTSSGDTSIVDVQCAIVATLAALDSASEPPCLGVSYVEADVNCSGLLDVSDVQIVVQYVLEQALAPALDADGDQCPDACQSVVCAGSAGPLSCDDGDPNTFDTCVDGVGCVGIASGSTCDPGSLRACSARGDCVPSAEGAYACDCPAGTEGLSCGRCASGFHLEHISNRPGLVHTPGFLDDVSGDEESIVIDPADYACVPDQTCEPDSCGPFGVCSDEGGILGCRCQTGYSGDRCQGCAAGYDRGPDDGCVPDADCDELFCFSHGSCADADGTLVCDCQPGFAPPRCAGCAEGFHDDGGACVADEACGPASCSGQGKCEVVGGQVVCSCDVGYGGPDCQAECTPETCGGNGTCGFDESGAVCTCDDPDLLPESGCSTCAPGLNLLIEPSSSCQLLPPCDAASCNGRGSCSVDPLTGFGQCACDTGWGGKSCWRCDEGFYLVGDACVANPECTESTCSNHGVCSAVAGALTCACDSGWGGDTCSVGLPPTQIAISGHDTSIEWGQDAILDASALGVGNFDTELQWSLVSGPGSLETNTDGTVTYHAPADGEGLELVQIEVSPACCPSQGAQLGLAVGPPGGVLISGTGNEALKPIDEAITEFMFDRCTGAAVFALNWKGVPIYRRGYGRTRGQSSGGRANNCGGTEPSKPVKPDTPMRIGSVTKAITAVMVRDIVRQRLITLNRIDSFAEASSPSFVAWLESVDDDIERVSILDPDLDLVPPDMRLILGTCTWDPEETEYNCTPGVKPPPGDFDPADDAPPADCDDDLSCYNGGVCTLTGDGPKCECPEGFSGERCWICPTGNGADARWLDMRLGDLLSHESGLPRTGPDVEASLEHLFDLRQEHDGTFQSVEDVGPLVSEVTGPGAPEWMPPDARVLERGVTTYETILSSLDVCLQFAPGSRVQYSNRAFTLLQLIAEYRSLELDWNYGGIYAGGNAHHSLHEDSLIDQFTQVHIEDNDPNSSGATRSRYGMFLARSPNPDDAEGAQIDPEEVQPRDFVDGQWNPELGDDKGVICLPDGEGGCDWSIGELDSFNNWGPVPYGYHSRLLAAGAGALLTEAHLYLRFMEKFFVGTFGGVPGYGRTRVKEFDTVSHSGGWRGTRAYVAQVGSFVSTTKCSHPNAECDDSDPDAECCFPGWVCIPYAKFWTDCDPNDPADIDCNRCAKPTFYDVPDVDEDSGDYLWNPSNGVGQTESCVLPPGLDFFVAVNQGSDPNDVDGGDYNFLYDAIYKGLCGVDWPSKPFVLMSVNNKFTSLAP